MQIKLIAGILLGLILVYGCASIEEANKHYTLGMDRYKADDYDAAIENFNAAIDLRRDQATFYEMRGSSKEKKGALIGAIADYENAIQLEPENPKYYELAVRTKINSKNFEGAINDLNKLVLIEPKYINYIFLGRLMHEKKDLDGTIAAYDRAIQLEPDSPLAYFLRGIAKRGKGDDESAAVDYDMALQLDPGKGLSDYYEGLARWKYKIGSMKDVITYSTEAIHLNPKGFNAFMLRAIAKKAIGDAEGFREDEKTYNELKQESLFEQTYH